MHNYTSTTTSKAWPSIYSMHLPLQSRLKAFGGSIYIYTMYAVNYFVFRRLCNPSSYVFSRVFIMHKHMHKHMPYSYI